MAEMDQDNSPDKDDADFDDELASLSADEKAAFDKIMAEISAATEPPQKSADEPSSSDAGTDNENGSAADAKEDTPSPAAVDEPDSTSEEASSSDPDNAPANGSAAEESEEDEEDLTDEQQAALDAIMAEIEGTGSSDSSSVPDSEAEDEAEISPTEPAAQEHPVSEAGQSEEDQDLSDDQQAALDAIMAEIDAKGDAGNNNEAASEAVQDGEALSDDQQAALDAIMSEINAKRRGGEDTPAPTSKGPDDPKETEAPADEAEQDDEALSDDQQAALDAIMSEINAKRGGGEDTPVPASKGPDDPKETEMPADEAEQDDEALSDDQQAALDAIMSEINAKRSGDQETAAADSEADDAQESSAAPISDNLTIEEFDDELTNLLTDADKEAQAAPAPEPQQDEAEAPSSDAERAPEAAVEEKRAYPILQEVPAEAEGPAIKPRKRGRGARGGHGKRALLVAFLMVFLFTTGGYYAYRYYTIKDSVPSKTSEAGEPKRRQPEKRRTDQPASQAASRGGTENIDASQVDEYAEETAATPAGAKLPQERIPQPPSAKDQLADLKSRLISAREQIQAKITDINQLKSYYIRGITEETEKIEQALEQGRIPAFDEAMGNKQIELALRAIQRRKTYIAKLGTPISQLTAMSEELLYLERRSDIFQTLSAGINGLSIAAFEQEATAIVSGHLKYYTRLSIDEVDVAPIKLATIWNDISKELGEKTDLLAQRAPLNRAIGREICRGNYERKYQLTALSPQTAACLIKWPGKDLYLNGLSELNPEAAELLSQWPGEWISLNGLKELPAASAKHLADWPGKRLSLNGLTRLSPEATAHLSKWRGEQLEMVGLHSIGSWENYGTRLYLSEKLRRRLEAQ